MYQPGFEEDDHLRSAFIRYLTLQKLNECSLPSINETIDDAAIPRILVRYWHDPNDVPGDVRECLNSWNPLQKEEGFEFRTFHDASAAAYISDVYGPPERAAFERCRHPAMRSDYLRMCVMLAEGGLYVDADDVLVGDGWKQLLLDSKLKLQPLCYDIPTGKMITAAQIWQHDLPTANRIFYVNNNPIIAPPRHPLLRRALARATERLLGRRPRPEIQSTTGPGNLTASLAAHAHALQGVGADLDFELIRDWSVIAETRWDLSYRNDARNWRNMDVC
ncbi:glycosyltransferase [Mesorhizobium sp. L103C131B0]|uniref:glycosyltransferase family 32 protein n=1 Tax=Mesorhizobium sp. L103C131B0 TaxID=1287089 RepID=UPI0003D02821|nr:glycosyltransferase [Mesorhizobium sp. L103C131B0]ESZ61602.1 hypothetical protein X729_12310 [Mesorhizobium sp. L103C131B0]